jgi:hypothetical protein
MSFETIIENLEKIDKLFRDNENFINMKYEIQHKKTKQRLQSTKSYPFWFIAKLVLEFAIFCGIDDDKWHIVKK